MQRIEAVPVVAEVAGVAVVAVAVVGELETKHCKVGVGPVGTY